MLVVAANAKVEPLLKKGAARYLWRLNPVELLAALAMSSHEIADNMSIF